MKHIINAQSGKAVHLKKGDILTVIDPQGMQVSDMVLFNARDVKEKLSSGKTLDFEASILLTTGNYLWSNRSNKMMKILEDTNGRNDFLLAPCSKETFEIMYNNPDDHPSCLANLTTNLEPYGIVQDDIPTAFNIFMNVQFTNTGKLSVLPPTSQAGDYVKFEAQMDVLVCLTACSAEDSNGGTFKPIHFKVEPQQ
ncbi:aminomethyltransferase [Formosa agariphila KMM 3901]|uniref:Aminomethyltransferase n=1 Tax=Formosa agariphila (strain DSM 15362 / KCTC 12365 / LMG 23005 / KMM 3901 / M-2Alg 35-1) TaxID=1347342 RepID=T2KNI1_FORAG|nr:urea carboxylase-associated family protein [Formosa agariphila]CDF79549.1 aminomethyltransferase [Formosa agariphila KMM 3901]